MSLRELTDIAPCTGSGPDARMPALVKHVHMACQAKWSLDTECNLLSCQLGFPTYRRTDICVRLVTMCSICGDLSNLSLKRRRDYHRRKWYRLRRRRSIESTRDKSVRQVRELRKDEA